jgi:two-component SAPR family response regulator
MVNVVRFGLLGPLLIECDGHKLAVPSPKQRALLAALLTRPNQVVPVGELADIVWNRHPPASAITTLRSHVKRLRRCLGHLGPDRITTSTAGYLIRIDDAAELDVAAFIDGIQRGRSGMLANDWPTAVTELRTALALWRGTPLSDVRADHFDTAMIPDLRRIRCQAREWYVEATLAAAISSHEFALPSR